MKPPPAFAHLLTSCGTGSAARRELPLGDGLLCGRMAVQSIDDAHPCNVDLEGRRGGGDLVARPDEQRLDESQSGGLHDPRKRVPHETEELEKAAGVSCVCLTRQT